MKNLKFGVFWLALAAAVGGAVAGLGAQDRVEARRAPAHGSLMMLDPSHSLWAGGPGSQLGVVVSDVDARQGTGVKVDEVTSGSAAAKAGFKAGDVVVEFDGERVRSARQFTRLVQETPDGRPVTIAVLRDGKKQTLEATPEARSFSWDMNIDGDRIHREVERSLRDLPRAFSFRMPDGAGPSELRLRTSRARLGVTVQELSTELADYFGAKNGGALVSSVSKGSAADQAGLKAGDVITAVNGNRVGDGDDLVKELANASGEVSLGVVRDKKEITLKASFQ